MAWAETSAPDLLRDPPAVSSDPIGDAVHADAEAAREEIRADGLICPSCGQNYADLIGRHCLILVMDVRAPWCECRDGPRGPAPSRALICPSCGQNYADLIGRHCLILVMDVRAPWCECRDGAQVPL